MHCSHVMLFAFVLLATPAWSSDALPPPAIAPAEAAQWVKDGKAVIVDVREKDEVDEGMAAPAQWFPTSKIKGSPDAFKAFLAALPKKSKVVFYCAAGHRAGMAAAKAAALGYDAANMGGYDGWVAAKLPTRKP